MFRIKIKNDQKLYNDFKKTHYSILGIKPKIDGTLLHEDFFKLCEYNIDIVSKHINRVGKEQQKSDALYVLSVIAIYVTANYIENNIDIPEEIKQNHIDKLKEFLGSQKFKYSDDLFNSVKECNEKLGIDGLITEIKKGGLKFEEYPSILKKNDKINKDTGANVNSDKSVINDVSETKQNENEEKESVELKESGFVKKSFTSMFEFKKEDNIRDENNLQNTTGQSEYQRSEKGKFANKLSPQNSNGFSHSVKQKKSENEKDGNSPSML